MVVECVNSEQARTRKEERREEYIDRLASRLKCC